MVDIDAVVIGAGVVGLAVARELAQRGHDVIVLEAAGAIGTGISSRNSEVIHAGIYYRPGSLMAALCTEGRALLYEYCASHGVPHKRCGKLIVATSENEVSALSTIAARGRQNGVVLHELSGQEARHIEPALSCVAALHSPSTGIVDSHAFMLAMQGDAADAGASFAFNAPVAHIATITGGFRVTTGGADGTTISSRLLVNCAGLDAPLVAAMADAMPPAHIPARYFARGNYFTLSGRAPFSHLIYPAPQPGGLGIHLTLDLDGQARFGPDVEWIDSLDYTVDPARAALFYPAIRRYWPDLPDGALQAGYAGIRPKIVPPAIAVQDFVIQTARTHGVAGLINLFGIESPGLTASLAIARKVADECASAD